MRLRGLATIALLTACSSSTGPDSVVTGTYVGEAIGLLATARAAEVSVPCQEITLTGPLGLRSDGTVDGAGTVTASPKGFFDGRAARVRGTQDQGTLSLVVEWFVDGSWTPLGGGTLAPVEPGTDHRVPATCIA